MHEALPAKKASPRGVASVAVALSQPCAGASGTGAKPAGRTLAAVLAALAVFLLCRPDTASPALYAGLGSSRTGQQARVAQPSGLPAGPVVRHSIERFGRPGMPDIMASYPSFGNPAVDRDIEAWIGHIVARFEEDFAGRGGDALAGGQLSSYGLTSSYEVESPSKSAASVTFELWLYTGQEHPGQDVITLNYSFLTGQRLGLYDIFEDVNEALAIMSGYSRSVLAKRLGRGHADGAILDGTAPDADNFANLALVPGGVRVHFQPYQVAPWEAGCQSVDIPLDTLAPARPLLALWGR